MEAHAPEWLWCRSGLSQRGARISSRGMCQHRSQWPPSPSGSFLDSDPVRLVLLFVLLIAAGCPLFVVFSEEGVGRTSSLSLVLPTTPNSKDAGEQGARLAAGVVQFAHIDDFFFFFFCPPPIPYLLRLAANRDGPAQARPFRPVSSIHVEHSIEPATAPGGNPGRGQETPLRPQQIQTRIKPTAGVQPDAKRKPK